MCGSKRPWRPRASDRGLHGIAPLGPPCSVMGQAHDRGRRGEEIAAGYLELRGWEILDRNWRAGSLEIDLVVRSRGTLAFVEVKTRTEGSAGHPLEAIGPRKRRDVVRAAAAWLSARRSPDRPLGDVRFDAIAVLLRPGSRPLVRHVPDAWRLSGRG